MPDGGAVSSPGRASQRGPPTCNDIGCPLPVLVVRGHVRLVTNIGKSTAYHRGRLSVIGVALRQRHPKALFWVGDLPPAARVRCRVAVPVSTATGRKEGSFFGEMAVDAETADPRLFSDRSDGGPGRAEGLMQLDGCLHDPLPRRRLGLRARPELVATWHSFTIQAVS